MNDELTIVATSRVVPDKRQPRKHFDQEKLEELARSIEEHGLIQPLLVQEDGLYYRIIAGERRWRAARIAGLKQVPVIIKKLGDKEVAEISLIENVQRENLNAVEEARAYKRLSEEFDMTQEEIAKRLSKSRSAIANTLRILSLPDEVLDMIQEGEISEGHARAIASISGPQAQILAAKRIKAEALSVRDAEKLLKANTKKRTEKEFDILMADLAKRLEDLFGTRVRISKTKQKGSIEIEFYSDDDLDRIFEIMLRANLR